MTERELQEGNLSPAEQAEYKTLTSIPAHLRTDEQMVRFGKLCSRANYWDQVAISPPVSPTRHVIASFRKVAGQWRAYSSSAYYGDEEHCGFDETGQCDSDSYYYLVPEKLVQQIDHLSQQDGTDLDWVWITVKTAPLGEPAGPLLSIGKLDKQDEIE